MSIFMLFKFYELVLLLVSIIILYNITLEILRNTTVLFYKQTPVAIMPRRDMFHVSVLLD